MKTAKVVAVFIWLLICFLWMFLTWPGSSGHGQFYPYPVTIQLFGFWAIGWCLAGLVILLVLKILKILKKR